MSRPCSPSRLLSVLLVVAVLAGCSDPQAAAEEERAQACQGELDALAAAIDGLAATYGRLPAPDYLAGATPAGAPVAERSVSAAITTVRSLGCDPAQVATQLAVAPTGAAATDPIAALVAQQLRASATGAPLPAAGTIAVATTDDLVRVVAAAPSGSVLELDAGEHRADDTLRVVRPLTIRGAGRDATTIRSVAEGVALLAGPEAELEVSGLALEHAGGPSAGVLQLDTQRYLLRAVRVAGGSAQPDGLGGAGILASRHGVGPPSLGSSTLLGAAAALLDVEVLDNEGPGVVLSGTAAPRIVRATVAGNGVCGVCYLDAAAGAVASSVVRDNEVGVLVSGTAAPALTGNLLADNRSDGLLIEDRARGSYTDNRVHGDGERGILVTDDAAPLLVGNEVRGAAELGIAITSRARPTLRANHVRGARYGVWAEGQAEVVLEDSEVVAATEIAVVVRDAARVTGRGNRCTDNPFDVALFDDGDAALEDGTCGITDER